MASTSARIEDLTPDTVGDLTDEALFKARQRMHQLFVRGFAKKLECLLAEMSLRGLKHVQKDMDTILKDVAADQPEQLFFQKVGKQGEVSFVPFNPPSTEPDEATPAAVAAAGIKGVPKGASPTPFEKQLRICKADAKWQIVTGIVYEPDSEDGQGDWMDSEEIYRAMVDFMKNSREFRVMHTDYTHLIIIENYIAPKSFSLGGQHIKKGSWILSVHIPDRTLWERVMGGELTGFSIAGTALSIPENPPNQNGDDS